MKLYVTRTSIWGSKDSPCDGAIKEKYFVENVFGDKIERSRFFINIENLEELMEFIKKQDSEVIVGTDFDGLNTIEIYDDYRE